MDVMPIVNKNRIINVKITLKTAEKIHKHINFADIKPNDIIVGEQLFSKSSFNTKQPEASDLVDFVRNNSLHNHNDFLVATKVATDSPYYDLYQVESPPKKVNKGLDNLYGQQLLDLKNEIPNYNKARIIDLLKLGVVNHISEEKLDLLQLMANSLKKGKENNYQKLIMDNDLEDLLETLEFINLFDCEIISSSTIDIESFEKVLTFMNTIDSKESKSIVHYYNTAKNNQKAYSRLSKLYNIVYDKPLNWIHKKDTKCKVKVAKLSNQIKETNYKEAA